MCVIFVTNMTHIFMKQLQSFPVQQEDNLLKLFEDIHNYIYANDGLSPQQTLDEFLKILFIKIYDENHNINTFYITTDEFSSLENSTFIDRINYLFSKTILQYSEIFDSHEKIKLSNRALQYSVNKLQGINLSSSSTDANGLAFQKMLTRHEKEGRGQYFTPTPVVDFCVKFINPQPGETIIDPCCGSGGFLYTAFLHLLANKNKIDKGTFINKYFFGNDISKSIARIAKMKFLLEANTKSNIHCTNSLEDLDHLNLILRGASDQKEGFDVLLTNPPFGTAGKITDKSLLSKYQLGYKWTNIDDSYFPTDTISKGQPAEILFVERCLDLLREGGRMAIVLPNGHFENPSLNYLRYFIKTKAKILAIVNLPGETFIPYGTGVKTSLLFLQKDSSIKKDNYKIFFSKIKALGYQGNKNGTPIYNKDKNGNILFKDGKPILKEDFSTVLSEYKLFLENGSIETTNSYCLNSEELAERFDFDYYAPHHKDLLNRLTEKSKRLGDIVDIVKVKSPILKEKSSNVNYIELSDVNTHSMEIINFNSYCVHELPSRASYQIKTGDIITAIAGNSVGTSKHATALVTEEYNNAICTNGFRVLRNSKVDPYYLLFFLKSELFLNQMMRYRTGAAIPNVSDNDFANILVYFPDENTIKKISKEIKKSFQLRKKSTAILNSISLNII